MVKNYILLKYKFKMFIVKGRKLNKRPPRGHVVTDISRELC